MRTSLSAGMAIRRVHRFPDLVLTGAPGEADGAVPLGATSADVGYGLGRICRSEPWHDEVRFEAVGLGCPRMCADPTQDPGVQW
ncbi:hypothetical protein QF027_004414 [Streptomyces canus]|nr:hypothetical protein [Streptomyces canus]